MPQKRKHFSLGNSFFNIQESIPFWNKNKEENVKKIKARNKKYDN